MADRAIQALEAGFQRTLDELVAFARIPGVSAEGFDPGEVRRSAEFTTGLLARSGLEDVEILERAGAHPYVVGSWLHAGRGAPTVLLYAHHDVQPPGRRERWETPPFEPTLRSDGRLYGRGVVDDKAGLALHLAAIRAVLEGEGGLPVNVKLIVEGEEEIGSPHLEGFLRAQRERLRCDVIVLSDTANLATGIPSLTTSLRGILSVDVTVRVLDHPIHSGMWGGPVGDAQSALARLLARLCDDRGEPMVPGLDADCPKVSPEERAALAALPFDVKAFRRDAGLLEGTRLAGAEDGSVYERLWLRPAIAVLALDGIPIARASNQLVDIARARVSVRLAPGQDPDRAADTLETFLRRDPPRGAQVETRVAALSGGWRTEARGPAFDAARRALAAGFGREPVAIGCGGTIPFVGPFSEVMGGVPALLLGLEDPICNAHGENESLCVGDFRKASRASLFLLRELRRSLGKPARA